MRFLPTLRWRCGLASGRFAVAGSLGSVVLSSANASRNCGEATATFGDAELSAFAARAGLVIGARSPCQVIDMETKEERDDMR